MIRFFVCVRSVLLQKRRSGRQVKRRKYNEDLDFKVVDDDGETIAVLGAGRIPALSSTLAWQAEVTVATSAIMAALHLRGDNTHIYTHTHRNDSHLLFSRNPLKMKPTSLKRYLQYERLRRR